MKSSTLSIGLLALAACSTGAEPRRSPDGAGGSDDGGAGGGASDAGTAGGAVTSRFVGAACDDVASCGDYGSGCVACAIKHGCADVYRACIDSLECVEFSTCADACAEADTSCDNACVKDHPEGKKKFEALVLCTVCDECPTACGQLASICP